MPDLQDGESVEIKGSARLPYIIKNVAGVYSCSCPAWRNQSITIDRRTCKHIRQLRGEQAEKERLGLVGQAVPETKPSSTKPGKSVPELLLAHSWDGVADLTGWWLSEKLDGVRAWWDGKQFLSRQGNVFHAPAWFTAGLPETPLDGELWLARKAFQRTVSIVRRQTGGELWRELKFRVFDMPTHAAPFEKRIEQVQAFLRDTFTPFVEAVEQSCCRDFNHLHRELNQIIALGGEGLMVRQPGSAYEAGRSTTLLKIKQLHDAEALVIGHQPGKGRHKGRLGALEVELPDGTQFSVGTGFSDAQREHPPAISSQITFRYQELTDRGVPRFPSFVRVRSDATN
ncbi:MAG: DNA ligase [Pirellulales bacterium]